MASSKVCGLLNFQTIGKDKDKMEEETQTEEDDSLWSISSRHPSDEQVLAKKALPSLPTSFTLGRLAKVHNGQIRPAAKGGIGHLFFTYHFGSASHGFLDELCFWVVGCPYYCCQAPAYMMDS
jgi:hypothetical protein